MRLVGQRRLLYSAASLKLSNKALSASALTEKSSFTPSKLRFFELREPCNPSCYTISIYSTINGGCYNTFVGQPLNSLNTLVKFEFTYLLTIPSLLGK